MTGGGERAASGGTAGRLAASSAPLVAAVLVAIAVRAEYARELAGAPAFLQPVLDAAMHVEWARGLRAGTWPGAEPFFRAPGYPVALAALLRVAGDDPVRAAHVQLFLGAFGPALVAGLAGRLAGRAAAWIAGLAAAVYPTFLFFDAQLLGPALAVPLTVAAASASVQAVGERRGGEGRDGVGRWAAAAGLLWGAAALVRPPLLLAGVLLPAMLGFGRNARRGAAALALAGVALLPGLVTLRNAVVAHDPVPIASSGGLNLWLGNGPSADGMAATFAEAPTALGWDMTRAAAAIAAREAGRPLSAGQVSRWWTARTLRAIAGDPGRWLALMGRKTLYVLLDREIPNNHDPVLFAERLPLLRDPVGWGAWLALAVVGAVLGRRRAEVRFLAGATAAVLLGCVIFFVNARFRVPAAPLLIALGAGGAVEVARRWRASPRRALAPLGGAAAVLVVSLANPLRVPADPWPMSYVLLADAESARGEPVRSLAWIDRALAARPGLYPAVVARIELLRAIRRFDEALAEADRAVAALPNDARLRRARAVLLDLTGDPAAALAELDVALALDPTSDAARVDRAIVLARLGREPEAVEALRTFLATRATSVEAARARSLLIEIEAGGARRRSDD